MFKSLKICIIFLGFHALLFASNTSSNSSSSESLTETKKRKASDVTSYDKFAYNAQRTRNLYNPSSTELFKISRSKLDSFMKCPQCFFINSKCGTGKPAGYPFTLNCAVDECCKITADNSRKYQTPHPDYIVDDMADPEYSVGDIHGTNKKHQLVSFQHDDMDKWRDALHAGLQYAVPGTNILLTGAPDDIAYNPKTNELHLVDVKATSKKGETSIDAPWQKDYLRQVEVYTYLLSKEKSIQKQGLIVSNVAYFLYLNAQKNPGGFTDLLYFKKKMHTYVGDHSWVEPKVQELYQCLQSDIMPDSSPTCADCQWHERRSYHKNQYKK